MEDTVITKGGGELARLKKFPDFPHKFLGGGVVIFGPKLGLTIFTHPTTL